MKVVLLSVPLAHSPPVHLLNAPEGRWRRRGCAGSRALPTPVCLITISSARGRMDVQIVVARDSGGKIPPTTPSRAGDAVQPLFDAVSPNVTPRSDQEVVEVALLLPLWQAVELEAAASRRGMTTGQMLRRVIGELLAAQPAPATAS